MSARARTGGPIAWMARHGVAPNLLMLVMVLGGLLLSTKITQEVFPSSDSDIVTISVALPGAAPAEVEESVILVVEDALGDVTGIDKLTSTASVGFAAVTVELSTDRDRQLIYDDIRQAVDQITTLPEDAEPANVRLQVRRRQVLEIHIFGDVDPMSLRMAAEQVRERLLDEEDITVVELFRPRGLEIHAEIPQDRLRAHGLTLQQVADVLRRTALDLSSGSVETRGGEILLRMADREESLDGFARVPLIVDPTGTVLRLGDIAVLRQGFADDVAALGFDGMPSQRLDVYRVGDQTPTGISDAVRRALPEAVTELPEAISVEILEDDSEIFKGRMHLLLTNGFMGLALVLLVLSLFLEFKLAFWVAVGIPTAFLGSFLLLEPGGASINMITMFAFILALGIVVDDAIVVGENIYEYLERGMSRMDAAIQGTRDIAVPLGFSILTNIVAFLPLAMVPGGFGKFFIWIPMVVSAAFLLSWIEALFVLPAHLASVKRPDPNRRPGPLGRVQKAFSAGLAWVIQRGYAPLLVLAMRWRYATVAVMVGILVVVMAWPMSGRMGFGLFPSVPRDYATVTVKLPVDAPESELHAVSERLTAAARQVFAENGGDLLGIGVHSYIFDDRVTVKAYLQPPEIRPVTTAEVSRLWREAVGELPSARYIRFSSSFGGPGGASGIEVQLSHSDVGVLSTAARRLVERLGEFDAVQDPEDGFVAGKAQLEFRLTETGRALGLSAETVGAQVRAAFFGVEALSQQQGRNEMVLRVRLPEGERRSEADVETLLIRTPEGGEVPLYEVATVERSRADAIIEREDGRRRIMVTAEVKPEDQANRIIAAMRDEVLPQLVRDHPGLGWTFRGRQETQRDTMQSFTRVSIPLALLLIYGLLAIPFRSYVQPMIVMAAIPFGVVGAVLGHMLMGMSLSIVSIFGIIALSGVVINAAIVMIDYANRLRLAGHDPFEAMRQAGVRRFRPILLTTMTTFGGLAPMIFETSRQARFLIPMAVSLGYGIVFATLIVLVLIPALYLILEDIRWLANPPAPAKPKTAPLQLTRGDISRGDGQVPAE